MNGNARKHQRLEDDIKDLADMKASIETLELELVFLKEKFAILEEDVESRRQQNVIDENRQIDEELGAELFEIRSDMIADDQLMRDKVTDFRSAGIRFQPPVETITIPDSDPSDTDSDIELESVSQIFTRNYQRVFLLSSDESDVEESDTRPSVQIPRTTRASLKRRAESNVGSSKCDSSAEKRARTTVENNKIIDGALVMVKPRFNSRSNPLGGRVVTHDDKSKSAWIEIFNQSKNSKVPYANIVIDPTEIQDILHRDMYREPSLANYVEFIRQAGKFHLRKDVHEHYFTSADQIQ